MKWAIKNRLMILMMVCIMFVNAVPIQAYAQGADADVSILSTESNALQNDAGSVSGNNARSVSGNDAEQGNLDCLS